MEISKVNRTLKFLTVILFSLIVVSCEVGLGSSVDTLPPELEITTPPVDSIIRDSFIIGGSWSDDGKIAGMTPVILRGITEGKHYYRIHKNGYRDAGGSVVVKGGKAASVSETITKYSEASSILEAESEMKPGSDQASILSKSLEIARTLDVDNLLVVYTKIGKDEKVNYTGYMIDKAKREFKKSEAVFDLPEKGAAAKSEPLREFNKALIEDPYEYKSISDVFAAEVLSITSEDAGREDTLYTAEGCR